MSDEESVLQQQPISATQNKLNNGQHGRLAAIPTTARS